MKIEPITWVVSFGGAGSKLLTRLIYPNLDFDTLENRHVHWRHLRPETRGDKFVYVFGDPRNTVISFFQRRISRHTKHGFSPPKDSNIPMPAFVQWAINNLESTHPPIPQNWDFDTYIENGAPDIFQLENHFDTWFSRRDRLDIKFISYDAIWTARTELIAHGILESDSDIPVHQNRRADWTKLPIEQKSMLNQRYEKFANRLSKLPNVIDNSNL
jgi:hypothetical protein